jgi:hypothetical protein
MGTRFAATIATALLILTGATCSGDDDDSADSTTSTTKSPEAEVESAYLGYWDMLSRLAAAPDPEDQDIAQRASGEALLEVKAGLTSQLSQGQIARTGPAYGHTVTSVEVADDRATVRDCAVDDSTIVDKETGETVGGGEAATGLIEAELVHDGDSWKVDAVDVLQTWPGATECEE